MPRQTALLLGNDHEAPDRGTIVIEEERLKETFTQIPNTILRRDDLTTGAKLAYMVLLSYAWQEGSCFPGQDKLAVDMGVVRRSVVTYLQQLQDNGLLQVKRRGLGKTNIYTLSRWDRSRAANLADQDQVDRRSAKFAHLEVQKTTHLEVQNLHANNTQREEYSDIRNSKSKKIRVDHRITDQTTSYRINHQQKRSARREAPPLLDGDGQGQTVYQQIATAPRGAPHPTRIDELLSHRRQALKQVSAGREQAEFLAYIGGQIERYANELDDQAEPKWSINSILRLFRRSNLPQGSWEYELRQAFNQTAGRDVGKAIPGDGYRRNRFPYFRQVLADRLGLKGVANGR